MKPILQYLSGGSVGSLFVDYTPFQGVERTTTAGTATTQTSEKISSDEKSSGKAGLKDLLGLLKEVNALPTDLDALAGHIGLLYSDATLFGGEVSQNDLVSIYLSSLRLIGRAASNLREYNEAKKEATANGGINEVAIDLRGHIFVLNQETGEILTVTPQEYGDLIQQGNYQALTNSNLLYLRREDPNFAFKNDILNTVLNGIGIDKVTLMIMNITNKIGETNLQQEGYSRQTAQQIMSGVEQFKKAQETGMTVEGLYHQSLITKSQLEEAQKALTYIWNTLPSNAKTRLMVASAEMGNENVEAGAYNLIGTLIESGLKTSRIYSVDLVKDPNNSNSSSSNSGSGDNKSYGGNDDKSNPYFNMVKQLAGENTSLRWKIGNVEMGIDGKHYSEIPDINGKPVGETSVADLLHQGLGSIVTDKSAIVFGNKLLQVEDLYNIMYLGDGGTSVILPCKKVNGKTIVDLSIMEEYEQACKDIAELHNPTEEQKAQIYIAHNLMQLVDLATGKPNMERFALFLVINAIGVNKNNFLDNNSDYFEEITNPESDYVEMIRRALSRGDGKKESYEMDPKDKMLFEGNYDELYRGVMYIPLTVNELQARTAFDKHVKGYYDMEADYQRIMKANSALSANSQVLGLTR